jgi:CRP-like cAMP-binding protein
MHALSPSRPRNRLLAALSPGDRDLLQPSLQSVPLGLRKKLEIPNRAINDVYFPHAGIASVVAVQSKDTRVEVGLIGAEGMTGTAIVLGSDRSPHETYMQVEGEGHRITATKLREAIKGSDTLRDVLLRWVQVFTVQTAHTAITNARAKLDKRLARWLLMAHDRVRDDTLPLTHEFLGLMLGVRRASVTETLQSLESQNLITAGRGHIIILNRRGIERTAGEAYGTPEAEYRRLIG